MREDTNSLDTAHMMLLHTKTYRKFPKYSDTQKICCNHSKNLNYVALP